MLAQESRAALAAFSFLTRVPVRRVLDGGDVRRAGPYFPVVGALVGAAGGLVARRGGPALSLVFDTVLTGALHLDALADSADSLGSADRERALEIMRDSRVGSFGVAAICLDLMVRSAALEAMDDPVRAALTAGALSRAVPVTLSAVLPYAREQGTAGALSTGSPARAAAGWAVATAISRDPEAIGVAAVCTAASAAFWYRKLGGITGDGLGASIELTQTAILVFVAARPDRAGRLSGSSRLCGPFRRSR